MKNAFLEYNLGQAYYLRTASPQALNGTVSKTLLWNFSQSPYRWRHAPMKEATKAMSLGSLIHSAILTPNEYMQNTSISPFFDYRTKAAQLWRNDQLELGHIIASDSDIRAASGCEQVFAEDYAQRFGVVYKSEVAVFAEIGATYIKGMIDLVPDGLDCLIDLKTTAIIGTQAEILRTIIKYGYHWQAALYLDLYNAATKETRNRFIFCFIEVAAPYETAWFELTPDFIQAGRVAYMQAIAQWQACCATDSFPPQHAGITILDKPKYI